MNSVGIVVCFGGYALAMELWIWVQRSMPADLGSLASLRSSAFLLSRLASCSSGSCAARSTRRDIRALFQPDYRAE